MSVPDNELIAEVLLTSEGFASAAPLARKLVSLFGLGAELLSPQQHYDWGLRALKTVLGIAGGRRLVPAGCAWCRPGC
jgi:dynein heavy chain 2